MTEKITYRRKFIRKDTSNNIENDKIPGVIFGNVSNASTLYGEVKFNASRGHGFAAERANHQDDVISGKDAKIVGDDNIKNGADRLVDNQYIQTKYCSSASKSIAECFENKTFRYFDAEGKPMQIEVPSDQYDGAVQAMQDRIKNGQVPGVTDPKEAINIVRKGHYTYEQAKNIAKAGTVDSLKYDAVNGSIVSAQTLCITSAITFAVSIWDGKDVDEALKQSLLSGLDVGAKSFVTAVLAGQVMKAGGYSLAYGMSQSIIDFIGPKASAHLVNAFRSGSNIYGVVAMKSAQKMLGNNIVTGVASVFVLSSVDVVNIFRGRISGAQLVKNLVNTSASVAGGVAGWSGGATAGAAIGSVVPVVGTAIGGIVGGLLGSFVGGSAANKFSSSITDTIIEDDAKEMLVIIENVFKNLAYDYLLNEAECKELADSLHDIINSSLLKDMYAVSDRTAFAYEFMKPIIDEIVTIRKVITLPTEEEQANKMITILENFEPAV